MIKVWLKEHTGEDAELSGTMYTSHEQDSRTTTTITKKYMDQQVKVLPANPVNLNLITRTHVTGEG